MHWNEHSSRMCAPDPPADKEPHTVSMSLSSRPAIKSSLSTEHCYEHQSALMPPVLIRVAFMKTSFRCVGQAKLAVKSSPFVWDPLALAEVEQQAAGPSDDNPLIERSADYLSMMRSAGAVAAGSSLSAGARRFACTRPAAPPLCTSALPPHTGVPQHSSGNLLASQVPTASSLNSTVSGDSDPKQGRRVSLSVCLQAPPPPRTISPFQCTACCAAGSAEI